MQYNNASAASQGKEAKAADPPWVEAREADVEASLRDRRLAMEEQREQERAKRDSRATWDRRGVSTVAKQGMRLNAAQSRAER